MKHKIILASIAMILLLTVNAFSEDATDIKTRAPNEGKYAEISNIEITNTLANETVQFNMLAINFGTENIGEIYARIKILGTNKAQVAEVLTQRTSLESQKRILLNATWNSEKMNLGEYYAVAELFYDGKSANKEKAFSLGKLSIKVLEVKTGEYNHGGIAKFTILLENEWDERIDNVYGELDILNNQEEAIAIIKAQPISLEPHKPTVMVAYWDTAGQKEGEYLMNLRLRYKGIEQDVSLISDLTYNGIKAKIIRQTGEAIAKPISAKAFMPIAAVLLVVINIIIVAYYRRKNK